MVTLLNPKQLSFLISNQFDFKRMVVHKFKKHEKGLLLVTPYLNFQLNLDELTKNCIDYYNFLLN